MNPDNLDIVLVHTTHSGNIGGVARAMKNMGLTRLTLVAPLDYPAPEATWRAASAVDVIESARVVDTLDEAIADCQFIVGTSARERRIPWPVQDARRCAERVRELMSDLPPDQAQILAKVYMEGKSHSEAAAELDLPLGTVKSRVRLAIQKLPGLMEA